jgi:transcriptional regulator with XRE-family HTH domain
MPNHDLNRLEQFGEQVERWLLEAGWSQSQLARAGDLSTTAVSRLVRTKELRQAGKYVSYPTTSTIHKILDALSSALGPNIKKQGFQILRTDAPPQVKRSLRTVHLGARASGNGVQLPLPLGLDRAPNDGDDDPAELLRMIQQLPRETRTCLRGLLQGLQKGETRATEVSGAN